MPVAMQAALIPQVNTLFAVGLVSLPGMMTGQILSGVPPLIAARYQINGDVYVVRFSRNIDSILPPFPKTVYPGHTT